MKKENKRAFTLIELMGVLVIIGVLSVILVPVISKTLKENKEKLYQKQLTSIKLAAQNLGSDNTFILPTDQGETIYVTLDQLKKSGYIDKSIINPKTKEKFSDCTIVEIMRNGGSYEYNVLDDTLNSTDCQRDSVVTISKPSKRYIKKGVSTSYIVIVKPSDSNSMFTKYNIDNSKILLTNNGLEYNGDTKYSIVGENGIYKLTIKAGSDDVALGFTLKPNSITDENGNNLVENDITTTNILVDNTAPTLAYELNGGKVESNSWSNQNVNRVLKPNDTSSGIKKVEYSIDRTNWYEEKNIDSSIFSDGVNNTYYRAIDNAGNVSEIQNIIIKVDTIAPTLAYELRKINNGVDEGTYTSNTWSQRQVKRILTATDSGSKLYQIQYSSDNTNWYEELNASSKIFNEGTNDTYYRVVDNAGNASPSQHIIIKVDWTAPTLAYELRKINSGVDEGAGYSNVWSQRQIKRILKPGTDTVSGVYQVQYSSDNINWYKENNVTSSLFSEGINDTYYRVVDNAGNASPSQHIIIKVDWTAPTAPTVALVKGDWSEVYNNTYYNFGIYVAGKANSSDPNPSSTDEGSKVAKYQISETGHDDDWHDWSYDCSNSLYYIAGEENKSITKYRYIRAVDNAENISSNTTKTIKIDRAKPTVTDMKGCTPNPTYTKCRAVKYEDDNGGIVIAYRSHCAVYGTSSNTQSCYYFNAYNRLNYYINNNNTHYGSDNKSIHWNIASGSTFNLNTSFDKDYTIQSAVRACDQAGNCSDIKEIDF